MIYYKIPLTDGLDYPAGCILCCAYTYDGYEYCKFERVTDVGSGWVKITEAEFNVRCPEFPAPIGNCHVYVEDWSDIDSLLEADVLGMAVHTERSYSLTIAIGNLYGAARLTVYKGVNDDGMEEARADLLATDGHTCHRIALHEGSGAWAWNEWAWDNPPMKAGVEYLTTEEVSGIPVYTKRIVLDTPQAGASTYADIVSSSGSPSVISLDGAVTDLHEMTTWPIPAISNTGKILASASIIHTGSANGVITLKLEVNTIDASASHLPASFRVKYTK